jgi:hypothetical protein|tara:strand:+ start:504 stop:941 length:438 start_codon:yes stop_codon:yes gene_type:complete
MFEIPWDGGLSKYWFDNGIKSHEGLLSINRCSEKDDNYYQNGKWTYWYTSGKIFCEVEYDLRLSDNGYYQKPIGIWKYWNEDGIQTYEVIFDDNIFGGLMICDNIKNISISVGENSAANYSKVLSNLGLNLFKDNGEPLFTSETP